MSKPLSSRGISATLALTPGRTTSRELRERFGDRAEFKVGDATKFPAAGQRFEVVLILGVLHDLDNGAAGGPVSVARTVLPDGGRLVTVDLVTRATVWSRGLSSAGTAVSTSGTQKAMGGSRQPHSSLCTPRRATM